MCGTSSPASRLVDLVRQHWQKENVDLEKRNIFRSGSVKAQQPGKHSVMPTTGSTYDKKCLRSG